MIMPLNLVDLGDKKFRNICVKHINAGLLLGIDYIINDYANHQDPFLDFKKFFPRGFYGDFRKEFYRLRDIITSKLLYILGDFDKYVVMNLLANYYQSGICEYSIKVADAVASNKDVNLGKNNECRNFHIIRNDADRKYVIEKFAIYSSKIGSDVESLLASIEDLNKYLSTCFVDVDFLSLGDYSIEEMKALSTMKEYSSMCIVMEETRLYLPYKVIK